MIVLKVIGWILLVLLILLIVLLHISAVIYVHAARDGISIRAKYLFLTLYPRKKRSEGSAEELSDDDDLFAEDLTGELAQAQPAGEVKPEEKKESKKEDSEPPAETAAAENTASQKVESGNSGDKKKKEKQGSKEKEKEEKSGGDGNHENEKKPGLRERITSLRRKYERIKPYIPTTWKYFKKLLRAVRITIDDVNIDVGRDDAHEAAIFYGSIQWTLCSVLDFLCRAFTLKVKKCNVNCRFTQDIIDGSADITVRIRPSTALAILICFAVKALIILIGGKIRAKKARKAAGQDNTNNTAAETA